MSESTYWTKFWRRRLSRRRLLAGAALTGSGLATAAVVGCGGGGNETGGTPGGPTTTGPAATGGPEAIIDARRALSADNKLLEPGVRGGTLRYIGYDAVVLDRYDPHQTQFGPMYANTSAVFSKLYMYKSHEEPTWENIVPDLAEDAPEMVEDPPLTYTIKLRRGVKFHDNERIRSQFPTLAGRELTADDVIFSFDRQRNRESPQWPFYYRSSQYETIDTIKKLDDYTIQIVTKRPVAPFYHFMADTNAMIIPKEIVDKEKDTVDIGTGPTPEQRMIGTGPFMWDKLSWGIEYKAVRNPTWFGWNEPDLGRPFLDAYAANGQGLDDASLEAFFREKKIDVAGFVDNPNWVYSIKDEKPELLLFEGITSGWVNSRLKVYCDPFKDPRVRKALYLATDRQQVVDVVGSGTWIMQGPVGGAIKYWALPQDELEKLPGYRQTPAERAQDIAEAKQLLDAAGSPGMPELWNADIPAYIPRFMPVWSETMKNNLGISVRTQTQPYSRIAEGLLRGCDQIAWGWGFDNGWIDLDDWVYPYFHSLGSKNSFVDQNDRLAGKIWDADLDAMLDDQRQEFDAERRKELGREIQYYILGLDKNGKPLDPIPPAAYSRLDYAAPAGPGVSWPYYKNRVSFPWFGNNQWIANIWLDTSDPSYQGRPS
ncbi:MAG: ABC transporter substrate-binding protein [Chloroflexi bacterium]|nr:ABC transporter substrate-binding protein [Chloroflexota bacterium]